MRCFSALSGRCRLTDASSWIYHLPLLSEEESLYHTTQHWQTLPFDVFIFRSVFISILTSPSLLLPSLLLSLTPPPLFSPPIPHSLFLATPTSLNLLNYTFLFPLCSSSFLVGLLIEQDVAHGLDYDGIIEEFGKVKVWNFIFYFYM